ncbi:hypothetical protein INP83_20440 [Mucilaginibacter sp. 21P]|uniref:hypothetical protein n=1 Tax=Mucilaginibacter sp. 21P TaxID=2778902 RepID=UPI001C59599F|nr:hypothetical protein [Mucilaginibacter sp. 21P]QXV65408.1 hypothetical protein INP83_20440 [Mucilaginibacter sp. 21P]
MEIDLTTTELFDDFSSFEKEDVHVDLHNAFNCKSVKYSNHKMELVLYFLSNSHNNGAVRGVSVVFSGC